MMKTLVITATAMVLAAPAFAQTPSAPPASPPADTAKPVDVFAKADGNKDGALTIAEVKLADPAVTQADFDKADSDKSKSLSKTEFDKWAMAKPADKASAPGQ
ncbi:MAG TPA: EF-hand domain-containing protein [Hyphomonadaceae bacterium]|jgi:hypothetical protein|nr:EF-hand domain-containing protein [Hyphomonadaceae bacterium]